MYWATIDIPELNASIQGLKHVKYDDVFYFDLEEAQRKLGVKSASCINWNWVALEWIPPSLVREPRQILTSELSGWAAF